MVAEALAAILLSFFVLIFSFPAPSFTLCKIKKVSDEGREGGHAAVSGEISSIPSTLDQHAVKMISAACGFIAG